MVPETPPRLLVDPPDEDVGIEGRVAVEGQDLPRLRIHGHEPALQGVREDRVHVALQGEVQAEGQVLPRFRGHPLPGAELPDDGAQCVDLHVPDAGIPRQRPFVLPLQPRLADRPARLVAPVGGVGQLRFAHLPHVAHDVGHVLTGRIAAPGSHLHHGPTEPGSALLDGGDLLEGGVVQDDEGLLRPATVLLHQRLPALGADPEVRGEAIQGGTNRVGAPGKDRDGVAGDVLGHHPSVPVVDGAPSRRDGDGPEPVLLRPELVATGAEHLQPEEGPEQHQDHEGQDRPGRRAPAPPHRARFRRRAHGETSAPPEDHQPLRAPGHQRGRQGGDGGPEETEAPGEVTHRSPRVHKQ